LLSECRQIIGDDADQTAGMAIIPGAPELQQLFDFTVYLSVGRYYRLPVQSPTLSPGSLSIVGASRRFAGTPTNSMRVTRGASGSPVISAVTLSPNCLGSIFDSIHLRLSHRIRAR